MNTKEAVKFMEKGKELRLRTDDEDFPNTDEIIRLLKRGERFEMMWGEFEVYIEGKSKALTNKMNMLWQKYIIEKGG